MIRLTLLALAGALLVAAAAQAKTGDPRKCSGSPALCAQGAAQTTFRAAVAKRSKQKLKSVIPTCQAVGTTNLSWKCGAADGTGHTWLGTVKFKGTSVGWRTTVTMKRQP